jgi:hypothetical protein
MLPGKPGGPCKDCQHAACQEMRRIVAAICTGCLKPIGHLRNFYTGRDFNGANYTHATCRLAQLSKLAKGIKRGKQL